MTLSALKNVLSDLQDIRFVLPDGSQVPAHFHVTEIGQFNKKFIDCGGTVREEKTINFQLWEANDFDHRLAPRKLKDIITLSEKVLGLEDGEIEVEYQRDTIGKFGLDFDGERFQLTATQTACLANDKCGIPARQKIQLADLTTGKEKSCAPGSGCC